MFPISLNTKDLAHNKHSENVTRERKVITYTRLRPSCGGQGKVVKFQIRDHHGPEGKKEFMGQRN